MVLPQAGLVPAATAQQGADEIAVVAEGAAAILSDPAAAEEEAIWDAKRNAVEQAAGIFLRARAVGRDLQLADDVIEARTNGFIRKWELLPGSRRIEKTGADRLLRLQIRATVALLPVIQKLSDIQDVYDDLERPRIRVHIEGDLSGRARSVLLEALRAEGFEIASGNRAEIHIEGRLHLEQTVRLGDAGSPYGIGESLAACRARLELQILSDSSEEVLLTLTSAGAGASFSSDEEARREAAEASSRAVVRDQMRALTQNLLVRWARERQEGHVVVIEAFGLDAAARSLLRSHLSLQRGFRRFVAESSQGPRYTLRILTRLDTRALRQRLSGLRLKTYTLSVPDRRGPNVACIARSMPGASRR